MRPPPRSTKVYQPSVQQSLDLDLPDPSQQSPELPSRPTEEQLRKQYKYHCVVSQKYPAISPDRFDAHEAIESLMCDHIRKHRGTSPEDFRLGPTVDPLTGIQLEVTNTREGWVLYQKKEGQLITEMHRHVNAKEGYATWTGHSMSGGLGRSIQDQPDIFLSDRSRAKLKASPMRHPIYAHFLAYLAEKRIAYQESMDQLTPDDYARTETKIRAQEEAHAIVQARRQAILDARADAKRKLKAQKKERAKAKAAERARRRAAVKARLRGENTYKEFSSAQSKQHSKNRSMKHK